jgi:hypothetical protein
VLPCYFAALLQPPLLCIVSTRDTYLLLAQLLALEASRAPIHSPVLCCNRDLTLRNAQRYFSNKFQTDEYGRKLEPANTRPSWWMKDNSQLRPPSPSRLGEWRLVWRPKRKGTATSGESPAKDGRASAPPDGPRLGGANDGKFMPGLSPIEAYLAKDSARVPERGGEELRAGTARSRLSAATRDIIAASPSGRNGQDVGKEKRGGTAARPQATAVLTARSSASRASRGSELPPSSPGLDDGGRWTRRWRPPSESRSVAESMMSGSSRMSVSSEQVLERIRGLEEALRSEKLLREKMQAMLEESHGLGKPLAPGAVPLDKTGVIPPTPPRK